MRGKRNLIEMTEKKRKEHKKEKIPKNNRRKKNEENSFKQIDFLIFA